MFFHRQALAGEHGLVHGRGAFHHGAVQRNPLARPHPHQVSLFHLFDGHFQLLLAAVALMHDPGGLGLDGHQLLDGLGGAALGDGFQVLADHDEGQDGRRGLVIEQAGARNIAHGDAEGVVGAVDHRGQGADGDQGVHVRPQVHQAADAAPVHVESRAHHRQGQGQLHQGEVQGGMGRIQPGGQGHAPPCVPWPAPAGAA